MKNKPTIGLVMKSLQAEFFQEMKKGALEFASKHDGFELIVVGTSNQTEIEFQINLVDLLIEDNVDAIVIVRQNSRGGF